MTPAAVKIGVVANPVQSCTNHVFGKHQHTAAQRLCVCVCLWRAGGVQILLGFYNSRTELWPLIFGHMKGLFYRPSLWKGEAVKGDATHSEGMLCMQLGANSQLGG